MPLEPTEREEHFFKAMVDAANGSTPEELEPTERKERWYKEIIDAINTGGGGGSGGGVLMVNGTWDDNVCTLDKTWQEIYDGGFCVVKVVGNLSEEKRYCPIVSVVAGFNEYYVDAIYYGDTLDVMTFSASSASGYPSSTD